MTSRQSDTRSLWTAAGVVFAGNVIARGLGFLFPLVLVHAVTRTEFASVYYFIATGYFIGELVLAGFPSALSRELATGLVRSGLTASAFVGSLPLAVISIVIGEFLASAVGEPAGLTSLVVIGLTIDAFYFGILRGLGRFRLLAAYRVSANGAQIALLLLLVYTGTATLFSSVALYSLIYLVPIGVIEWRTRAARDTLRGAWSPRWAIVQRLGRLAVPALISGTAYAAITQFDVFFMRALSADTLSDYAAARSLSQPLFLVPFALTIVLMPRVAGSRSQAEAWSALTTALVGTSLAGGLAVVAYATLGDLATSVLLPSAYRNVGAILPLLAVGYSIVGLYTVLSQYWLGRGSMAVPAGCLSIGCLVTSAAHLYLIPVLGGRGAGLAICIGSLTAVGLLSGWTVRARRIENSARH